MIKRSSSTAMYRQIASTLRREIVSQKYAPGSCIGTQSELASRFGVSLITVKKAVALLEEDNLVVSRQGKGTFVQDVLLQETGGTLTALSTVFARHNLTPTISICQMSEIPTPHTLPEEVKHVLGKRCVYVERVHSVDSRPIGLTKIYLPLDIGTHILQEEMVNDSLYHIYQTKFGISLGHAVQMIQAGQALDDIADRLKIHKKSPVLLVSRESYSAEGSLLEFAIRYFSYNQYAFRIELDISGE